MHLFLLKPVLTACGWNVVCHTIESSTSVIERTHLQTFIMPRTRTGLKCFTTNEYAGEGGNKRKSSALELAGSDNANVKRRGRGPHVSKLLKVYKGVDDWHLPIFRNVREYIDKRTQQDSPLSVLYPGSSRHVTASLVFSNVTYVDTDKNVEAFFNDQRVLEWVDEHKEYKKEEVSICFMKKNFETQSLGKTGSSDLLISASAGIVSSFCAKYLKRGGYFLVSDAHFDARQTFLDQEHFLLLATIENNGKIHDSAQDLEGHFITALGTPITAEQVEESKNKPKARRSFKLKREGMFYLFQKK